MKITDHIYYGYDGKAHAKYEHKTIDKRERSFGTGTTIYSTVHETGWDAVNALCRYCYDNNLPADQPSSEWKKYYSDMDEFVKHMMEIRATTNTSEWEMKFSCDAPNHPGYYRANND